MCVCVGVCVCVCAGVGACVCVCWCRGCDFLRVFVLQGLRLGISCVGVAIGIGFKEGDVRDHKLALVDICDVRNLETGWSKIFFSTRSKGPPVCL